MKYERLKQLVKDELGMDIDKPYEGDLLGVNCIDCGDFFVCKDGIFEHRYLPERSNEDRLVKSYETEEDMVKVMFKRITVYPKLHNMDAAFLNRLKEFKTKHEGEL